MLRGLFLILFLGPLIELYVLIQVGARIGGLITVLLCVLTAALGAVLIRWQGMQTLLDAQRRLARGQAPAVEALHGAMLALAGVLLFVPGFVTDAIGFALLVPPVRRWLIRRLFPEAEWISGERPDVITVKIIEEDDPFHLP